MNAKTVNTFVNTYASTQGDRTIANADQDMNCPRMAKVALVSHVVSFKKRL